MATVRKRNWKSGGEIKTAWIVDYQDAQGTRRQATRTTRKAAVDFLARATYELGSGTHTPASIKFTIGEVIDQWLLHCEAEGLERGTIKTYRMDARHLDFLRDQRVAKLTTPEVERLRDNLLLGKVPDGRPRSRNLVGKVLIALKSALKEAKRRGQIGANAAAGVTVKTSSRHTRKLEIGIDVPDQEEARRIIAAAPDRWRALVLVAVFAGLRASELRGLRWSDVDLERRQIRVRQRADAWGDMGSPKSKAGQREVPLAPPVINALRLAQLASSPGQELCFPADNGSVLNHSTLYRRVLGDIQKAAGVVDEDGRAKYGPHCFRHFACSLMIAQGFQPKRIQTIMGHASFAMTMDRYGHLFELEQDDHARLAAGALKIVG